LRSQNRGKIMNKKWQYGFFDRTRTWHYSFVKWNGSKVILQRTFTPPSIDCNGVVSFENSILEVELEVFDREFIALSKEQFLNHFNLTEEDLAPVS
jgi:hypothetical protein